MSGPITPRSYATKIPSQHASTKEESDASRRAGAIEQVNGISDHDTRRHGAIVDKPGLRGPGLARTASIMKTPGSGIPTPKSAVTSRSGTGIMPPPTLIGRAQSFRKPSGLTNNGDSVSQGSVTSRLIPTRTPSVVVPKGIPQPSASGTSGGLQRSASTRLPGSMTSGAQPSKDVSKPGASRLHGRTQSISVKFSYQRQTAEPIQASPVSTAHARSKSTASGIDAARSLELTGSSTQRGIVVGSRMTSQDKKGVTATPQRPAFNTLQQHFSPAKPGSKPPLPSSRLGPSSEDISASAGATFETTRTQYELLYLSLLHQVAEPTFKAFEESAHASLRKTFTSLQAQRAHVTTAEQACQERLNLRALAAWTGASNESITSTNLILTDSIRGLSSCFNELSEISDKAGRHFKVVQEFTAWIERASNTINNGATMDGDVFVKPLPRDWHESTTSLSQRLRLLQREVEKLPRVPANLASEYAGSTLMKLLKHLTTLPSSMSKELEFMLEIEKDVLAKEAQRVEDAIVGIDLEALDRLPPKSAAWHT